MKHMFKQLSAEMNKITTRVNEITDKILEMESRPPNVGGHIYESAKTEFENIINNKK
jgi:hypothetical protein